MSPLFGIFGLGLPEFIVLAVVLGIPLVIALVVLVVVLVVRKKDEPRNE